MHSSPAENEKIVFAGIEITPYGLEACLNWIMNQRDQDSFQYVVTPNAAHVVKFVEDYKTISHLYNDAQMCVNDSRIIAKFGKFLGLDIPVCPGSDLTVQLLDELNKTSHKILIIGGQDHYLPLLRDKYANLEFDQYIPPMGFVKNPPEISKTIEYVKSSQSDIVFFAVGMPQQEILAWKCAYEEQIKGIGLCIGASIDFIVGTQKRAPMIWQKLSMEWLYRLLSDPKRMVKRYLVESPRMFKYAMKFKSVDQLKKYHGVS